MKIPENIPQYLKKAITVFNELMTDLRSISIEYENKINGLYALFVSLERVNMRYTEKMKSRNNNPQTAKQQLKARLQICKNMKQVLKNTKKYEDVLTDEQMNLLPNSCNIDPLKPRSESLTELTNPYFKKPPTKPAPIPNLLTKDKFTSEINKEKLPKISTSTDTTASPEVLLPQIQASPPNECSSTAKSAKSKQLHPWCRLTRRQDEIKDKSTEKTHPAMKPNKIESTNPSRKIQNSSNSTEIEHPEDSKDQIKTSSHTDLSRMESRKPSNQILISSTSTMMEHSEDSKEDVPNTNEAISGQPLSKMQPTMTGHSSCSQKLPTLITEQKEVEKAKKNELLLSSTHRKLLQNKAKIKYTKRKICHPIKKREVLSIVQNEEAYPWEKEAAQNRDKESPLSDQTTKLPQNAHKLLPLVMKYELYDCIMYPESIMKRINDKIEKEGNKYVCINCISNPSFSTDRRSTLERHVKKELGYFAFRCSFCDEKSNDHRTIIKHYASSHGIPTNWLESN